MNNNYCIHCSMDCKDEKTHRLSYEVTKGMSTESLMEMHSIFSAIQRHFPGFSYCMTDENGNEIKQRGVFIPAEEEKDTENEL